MNPSDLAIGYGVPSYRPGDVIVSSDCRKAYRVQKDGSRRTMTAEEAAPHIARLVASQALPGESSVEGR